MTTTKAYRGDTITIPIVGTIPIGATVRVHLRTTAIATTYHVVDVVGQNIVILPAVSELCKGRYVYDVETTLNDVVTTLEDGVVIFKEDVTRTEGTVEHTVLTDLEGINVYAEEFYKRMPDGSLELITQNGDLNVNADWEATSGDEEILNKPYILGKITDEVELTADEIYPYDTESTTEPMSVLITDESGDVLPFTLTFSTTWFINISAHTPSQTARIRIIR